MTCYSRIAAVFALCALGLCGMFGGAVYATEGYQIISTQDLEQWLNSTEKPFVVFALSEVEFEEAHIPDSVCIPMEEMGTLGKMPRNLNTPIVFYCHGPG